MNAHTIQISERDYQTTLHSCGCPDFSRRGGGYIFYNFLTDEMMVGCKHMFDLYVQQSKTYMANQADKMQALTAQNELLELRIKKATCDRIAAEGKLADAQAEIRYLRKQLANQRVGV